jgi:hypothetical protein
MDIIFEDCCPADNLTKKLILLISRNIHTVYVSSLTWEQLKSNFSVVLGYVSTCSAVARNRFAQKFYVEIDIAIMQNSCPCKKLSLTASHILIHVKESWRI